MAATITEQTVHALEIVNLTNSRVKRYPNGGTRVTKGNLRSARDGKAEPKRQKFSIIHMLALRLQL